MDIYVIKTGGRVATDHNVLEGFLSELASLSRTAGIILVHGGGAEVSELSKTLGFEPRFLHGVRMTSPQEMPVVDMVLAGKMNTWLVRLCEKHGISAVGLSGCDTALFTGEVVSDPGTNCTGRVTNVNPGILTVLLNNSWVPVVSSVSMDIQGNPLNINADEAAQKIAESLNADSLVYVSDIPGVLSDNTVIPVLDSQMIDHYIENATIQGGMVPKVRSALDAVRNGVGKVIIGGYSGKGHLLELLEKKRGTTILPVH